MAPGRYIAAIATRSISPQGRPEDTRPTKPLHAVFTFS
jgi:hypothetical protein